MNLPNYKMYNQAAGIEGYQSAALGRLRDHYPPRPRENDGRTNPELLDSFSSRKRLAEADHTPSRQVYPMLMHRGYHPNAPIRNLAYMQPTPGVNNYAMHMPADYMDLAETPSRNIYQMRMPPNSHAPNAPIRNPSFMTQRPY
jgi:hypothetical protein